MGIIEGLVETVLWLASFFYMSAAERNDRKKRRL